MTHGNMGTWGKQEGDEIMAGDVVCEVETDKAVRLFPLGNSRIRFDPMLAHVVKLITTGGHIVCTLVLRPG